MRNRKWITSMMAGLMALSGCVGQPPAVSAPTTQQLQADVSLAIQALGAAGCAVQLTGAAAAPVISVATDEKGQAIFAAIDAAGNLLCRAAAVGVKSPPGTPLGVMVPMTAQAAAPPQE